MSEDVVGSTVAFCGGGTGTPSELPLAGRLRFCWAVGSRLELLGAVGEVGAARSVSCTHRFMNETDQNQNRTGICCWSAVLWRYHGDEVASSCISRIPAPHPDRTLQEETNGSGKEKVLGNLDVFGFQ